MEDPDAIFEAYCDDAPKLRGWSMKRGHQKRLDLRLLARDGEASGAKGLGRATVKRSVNRGSRWIEREEGWSVKKEKRDLQLEVTLCYQDYLWESEMQLVEVETYESVQCELDMQEVAMMQWKGDTEMDSDCSSTTCGSDSSSEESVESSGSSSQLDDLSPWERAMLRAAQAAQSYARQERVRQQEIRRKEKPLSKDEAYLAGISKKHSVIIDYDLKNGNQNAFEQFRRKFFQEHQEQFLGALQPLYQTISQNWSLTATALSASAQNEFLSVLNHAQNGGPEGQVELAFHGTNESLLASIYQKGLLVPGLNNDLRIVNGMAYGCGIYAGRGNNAAISWGYARGEKRPLLVCAVVESMSEEVIRHMTNFIVVFHLSCWCGGWQYQRKLKAQGPGPGSPSSAWNAPSKRPPSCRAGQPRAGGPETGAPPNGEAFWEKLQVL